MKPVQVKKVENVSVCILQVVRCLMSMSQVPVINDNVFFLELYFLPAARHPSCLDLPAYYADNLASDSEVRKLLTACCWTGNRPAFWHDNLYYNRDGSTGRHHGHVLHDHNVLQALPRLDLHP